MSQQRGGGGVSAGSGAVGGQNESTTMWRNNASRRLEVAMRVDPYNGNGGGNNGVKELQSEQRSKINEELVELGLGEWLTKMKELSNLADVIADNFKEFSQKLAAIPDLSAVLLGLGIGLKEGGGGGNESLAEPCKPVPEVVNLSKPEPEVLSLSKLAPSSNAGNVNAVRPRPLTSQEVGGGGYPPRQGQSKSQPGPVRFYEGIYGTRTSTSRAPHYNSGAQSQSWREGQWSTRMPSDAQAAPPRAGTPISEREPVARPPTPTPHPSRVVDTNSFFKGKGKEPYPPRPGTPFPERELAAEVAPTPPPSRVAVVADTKKKEAVSARISYSLPSGGATRPIPPPGEHTPLTMAEIRAMTKEELAQARDRLFALLKYEQELKEYSEMATAKKVPFKPLKLRRAWPLQF